MHKHIGYFENGINIDHITQGNAWYIIKLLRLDKSSTQVGIGLNLPSKRLGYKDLIKIENREISKDELNAISLFCQNATLSVIRNFEVIEKITVKLANQIEGIIECPNHRCISHEHKSKFITQAKHKGELHAKCYYCEQLFLFNELKNYNL